MVKRHSREVKANALRLIAKGHGPSAVARHLGLNRSTVAGWKREALRAGALESGEIGSERLELSEDVDSKARQLLARLEREMMTVKIKNAQDLRHLASAVGQLVTAKKSLDLLEGGKRTMKNSKPKRQPGEQEKFLTTRQTQIFCWLAKDAEAAGDIAKNFTLEEFDGIIEIYEDSTWPDRIKALPILKEARPSVMKFLEKRAITKLREKQEGEEESLS